MPKLNMVTPAGVQKPKGKKKGKVFVDDPVSTKSLPYVSACRQGRQLNLRTGEYEDYPCYSQCRERRPN